MRLLPLAVVAGATFLVAQEPFRARDFLPDDYNSTAFLDLAALRDTGVWDELDNGVLRLLLQKIEREAGFELALLDRMTIVMQPPEAGDKVQQLRQITILEGNAPLAVPDRIAGSRSYGDDIIGDYVVKRRQAFDDEVFLRPRPEVQILGSTAMLRPRLEGKPATGRPCADILSLLSGKRGSLFHLVVHLGNATVKRRFLGGLFPDAQWPAGDEPQYLMLRLCAEGDEDDPRIGVEAVVRHAVVGEGVVASEKALDLALAKVADRARLRSLQPLLAKLERKLDRGDLVLRLDLGRAREASSWLMRLVVPLLTADEVAASEPQPRK
ncbi:MAG: hypothetical protein KDC98_03725 [Planctomycetes bacterium]|nr:hypothetical protein [Planctomycetota bacterium]